MRAASVAYKLFGFTFFSPTESKIEGFSKLPPGWNHGEGIPPTRKIIERAKILDCFARKRFLLTDAVPGLGGAIQVAVYEKAKRKEKYLEVTLEPDDSFSITRYDKRDDRWVITNEQDVSSIEEVETVIEEFWKGLQECELLSEYSLKDTIIKISDASQAKHLRIMEEPSRLLMRSVSQTPKPLYVFICEPTTHP